MLLHLCMYKNKKKNNYQGKVPSSPYCFFLNSVNITEDINERVKMSFKNWWEETVVQWPWAIAIFILSMIIFNYLLLLFEKYKKKFSGKGKSTWKKLRHNISRDSLLVVHCYFFFSFIRFGHTVYCMNDYAFPAHCNNDDTRRLYYRLTQIDLYTFFFISLLHSAGSKFDIYEI